MSSNGRSPLLMSAIGRLFHKAFIVVHSELQLFFVIGGVRYSGCPLIGGFTVTEHSRGGSRSMIEDTKLKMENSLRL